MNIVLQRKFSTQKATDGVIMIDNVRVADCSERTLFMPQAGTYEVLIERCPQYRRKMPLIKLRYWDKNYCRQCKAIRSIGSLHSDLPCYCPMIKIGNGVFNRTDGSIIIGDHFQNGIILHSAKYYDRLIDRLDKAQNRGEKITLTITNHV